jgi:hypothetical protein
VVDTQDMDNIFELIVDGFIQRFPKDYLFVFTDEEFMAYYFNPMKEMYRRFTKSVTTSVIVKPKRAINSEALSNKKMKRHTSPVKLEELETTAIESNISTLLEGLEQERKETFEFQKYLESVINE